MSPILGIYASQISGHLFTLSGNYDALATVTVPSTSVSSITFAGIPQTGYSHLQVRFIYMNTTTSATRESAMQFNGDTGNNYADHQLAGDGSSASAAAITSTNKIYMGQAKGVGFGATVIDILDYANTNKYKTSRQIWGWDNNGEGVIRLTSGLWMNTNVINSITLLPLSSGNFAQYTQAALYGVKA
jgi:hypothetical protein